MTKAELVEKIHAKAGLPTKAKAEEALDAVVAALREALASGESVTFTGFGSFKVVERAARKGRNPRTGKEIDHPRQQGCQVHPRQGPEGRHQVIFRSADPAASSSGGRRFFMSRRALRPFGLCAPGPKVLYVPGCPAGGPCAPWPGSPQTEHRPGPKARTRTHATGGAVCSARRGGRAVDCGGLENR